MNTHVVFWLFYASIIADSVCGDEVIKEAMSSSSTAISSTTTLSTTTALTSITSTTGLSIKIPSTTNSWSTDPSITTGTNPTTIKPTLVILPVSSSNKAIESSPLPTVAMNSASNSSLPPVNGSVRSTANPVLSKQIFDGLVSSLVPGAGGSSNPMGSFGLLPTISKLSTPLAHIMVSNGQPSAEDVDQLLKALPEIAVLMGLSGLVNGVIKGNKGLDNIDLTKLPPQLITHVANGGQIPGVSSENMQLLTQRYVAQMGKSSDTASIFGASNISTPANSAALTPDKVNDLISGKVPLPPLNSLPPEYLPIVLSGGTLPGLTMEQTQTLKQMYTQQMFGGGGGSIFGGQSGSGPSIGGQSGSISSVGGQSGSVPLIGNVYANISTSQSITMTKNTEHLISELQNLDLSKVPPDVIQSFMAGKTPDLSKIPQDVIQSFINKSPQLFGDIVNAELQKKINGSVSIGKETLMIGQSRGAIPYDVNSLDRKADINMYHQDDDQQIATLWTSVALGVVALLTVVLVVFLCWRYQRKRKSMQRQSTPDSGSNTNAPSSIGTPNAVHSTIDETVPGYREVQENRANAEISRNMRTNGINRSPADQTGGDNRSNTGQWVFADGSRQRRDSVSTEF